MTEKKLFRVRPGATFGKAGERGSGEELWLDPSAGDAFPDKLEMVMPVEVVDDIPPQDEGQDYLGIPAAVSLILYQQDVMPEDLTMLSDAQLLALDNVGKATVEKIRKYFPYDAD